VKAEKGFKLAHLKQSKKISCRKTTAHKPAQLLKVVLESLLKWGQDQRTLVAFPNLIGKQIEDLIKTSKSIC